MDKDRSAEAIIAELDLAPYPERGWKRQTGTAQKAANGVGRPRGTCVYFLPKAGGRSHLPRVGATEIWHFHAGARLELWIAEPAAGPALRLILGPDPACRAEPQRVVPPDWWQAAASPGAWTLVSCSVSPGFRFAGFDLAPPSFDIPGCKGG